MGETAKDLSPRAAPAVHAPVAAGRRPRRVLHRLAGSPIHQFSFSISSP